MFIAKFNQASNDPFTPDSNGNYPYIGTLVAGKSKGTIINGTIFERENLEENTLYLCQNREREWTNPETGEVTKQQDVTILSTVTAVETVQLQATLGEPVLIRSTTKEATPAEEEERENLLGNS